jgi:hypothetical protein
MQTPLEPDAIFKDHVLFETHRLKLSKVPEGLYASCPCGAYVMIYDRRKTS